MNFKSLPIFSFLFITLLFILAHAANFDITNKCPYTVWAAALPGGGRQLNTGETWTISANPGTQGRIWARTNCLFDASGKGKCQTGDCDGLQVCQRYGTPPSIMAEYVTDQIEHQDFIDISVVDGFNVPMEFSSASGSCSRVIKCAADIIEQCPDELKAPGGCNGPCNSSNCGPTDYSRYFKERCPDAYSYPKDDPTSLFTCPTWTNYKVVFCP